MKKTIFFLILIILMTTYNFADANQADSYYYRAQQRIKNENYQGAIEDLTKAIYIRPENLDSYFLRANAGRQLGNYKGAIADYTKCIELASKNNRYNHKKALLFSRRALMKRELEDYQGAIKDYETAKELYKNQNDFKNYKMALSNIETLKNNLIIIKEEPIIKRELSAKDFMRLAKADFKKKDFKAAIEKISKAAELDPSNPDIYKARAMAKANLQDNNGALEDLYKVRDLYEKQLNFEGYENTLELIKKLKEVN